MEFFEDGTVNIHRLTDDGVATDETGKYTIDEANKVIDIDINVLCANTWVAVKSGKLNILSLTSDGLQIALPNTDEYAYSVNYYSQRKAEADAKIPVTLLCASSDGSGTWGTEVGRLAPTELAGQHTFTYEGSCSDAMVFALDFQGLIIKYPNAFVRIDEMKCDGSAIKFNANNFFYGDIEGNGNYRIELFNIYGKGAAGGNVLNSAFSNSQNLGSEPALHFRNSLEITYTVFTDGNGAGFYVPTVNMAYDWGNNQVWSYNQGAMFEVKYENFQYSIVGGQFDIKYQLEEGKDFSNGTMMTFIEVVGLSSHTPVKERKSTRSTYDCNPLRAIGSSSVITQVIVIYLLFQSLIPLRTQSLLSGFPNGAYWDTIKIIGGVNLPDRCLYVAVHPPIYATLRPPLKARGWSFV